MFFFMEPSNSFPLRLLARSTITRRGAIGALTAASYSRLLGANDRVQVGFIGYGLIGVQHVHDFKNQKDVDCAALAEIYQPRLEPGSPPRDSRQTLHRFPEDAREQGLAGHRGVPSDHWHALPP